MDISDFTVILIDTDGKLVETSTKEKLFTIYL